MHQIFRRLELIESSKRIKVRTKRPVGALDSSVGFMSILWRCCTLIFKFIKKIEMIPYYIQDSRL